MLRPASSGISEITRLAFKDHGDSNLRLTQTIVGSIIAAGLFLIATGGVARAQVKPTGDPTTKSRSLVPGDVIEVKVYRQTDLDTRARLATDGSVTIPLLGSVTVGGMSAEQAREHIRALLAKDYLVNPQVTLTIVEYAKNLCTVLGEVQRPGAYEIPPEQSLNLLQAIAMAGGYTRLGAPGKVTVQRLEQGQKKVYRLDTSATGPEDKGALFEILPGDMITVGERVF